MALSTGLKIYAFSERVTLPALQANHNTWERTPVEKRTPLMERNAKRYEVLSALKDTDKLSALTTFLNDNAKITHVRLNDEAAASLKPIEADMIKRIKDKLDKDIPLMGALNMAFYNTGLMCYHEISIKNSETTLYIVSEKTPDIFDKKDIELILAPHCVKDKKDMFRSVQLPPHVLAFGTLLQIERAGLNPVQLKPEDPAQLSPDKILGFKIFGSGKLATDFWRKVCTQGEHKLKVNMERMIELSEEYEQQVRDGRTKDEVTDVGLMVAQSLNKLESVKEIVQESMSTPTAGIKPAVETVTGNTISKFLADAEVPAAIRVRVKELLMEQHKKDPETYKKYINDEFSKMPNDVQKSVFSTFFKLFDSYGPTVTCELGEYKITFDNIIAIQKLLTLIESESMRSERSGTPEASAQQTKDSLKPTTEKPKSLIVEINTKGPSETHKAVDAPARPKRVKQAPKKTIDDLFPKGSIDETFIAHLRSLIEKYDELTEDGFKSKLTPEELYGKFCPEKEKVRQLCHKVKARLVDASSDVKWSDENDIGCKIHVIITHIMTKLNP